MARRKIMLTKKQIRERTTGIAGSDVAKLVGVSPFGNEFDVFMAKTSPELEDSFNVSPAMRWGHRKEPIIADEYAEVHNVELEECDTLRHKHHDIWLGTPDRKVFKNGDFVRGLEIKTAGHYKAKEWGKEGTDGIPLYYLCQVMWYMPLIDAREMDVAVLIGSSDYREYRVRRDDDLLDMMWDKAEFFWRHNVQKKNPPQVDGSDSCRKFLHEKYSSPSEDMIQADQRMTDLAGTLHDTRVTLDALTEKKKFLENEIRSIIGDSRGIEGERFKATWSPQSGRTFIDWKGVAGKIANTLKGHVGPDAVEKLVDETARSYTKKSNTRTFRFNWKKGE
jgi:putative phage-type endonuclease